ncbi:hypothetical protein QUF50_04975 [Thiotrichales bacterium HSG1]|nr:hypothetical protein [Thiotrichales bacterium HSG1]
MKIQTIFKYIFLIIIILLIDGCFLLKDCNKQPLPDKGVQIERENEQKEKEFRWTREF